MVKDRKSTLPASCQNKPGELKYEPFTRFTSHHILNDPICDFLYLQY